MDIYIVGILLLGMLMISILTKNIKIIAVSSTIGTILLLFITLHIGSLIYAKDTLFYLENWIYIDSFSFIELFIVSAVASVGAIYSYSYIIEELQKNTIVIFKARMYYVLYVLFLISMILLVLSNNILVMWLGIEATTLSTSFLIAFHNTKLSLEAAWKYVIICSVGIILGLIGIILFIYAVGAEGQGDLLNWTVLSEQYHALNGNIIRIAFTFIFVGIGTKAGLAPMHTWISDSYSESPSPISAMMSGTLINLALYIIVRFYIIVRQIDPNTNLKYLFIAFGCISLFVSSFSMLKQNNYKRLLAFSSVENIGIITLGIGIGGSLATFGALLHSVIHALAKTGLFLICGNIFAAYKTKRMDKIQHLIRTMPINAVFLILGMLVITGAPPFASFFSEFYILIAGINNHQYIAVAIYTFSLLIAFAGFLIGFLKMIFTGESGEYIKLKKDRENILPVIVTFICIAAISLLHGSMASVILNKAVLIICG